MNRLLASTLALLNGLFALLIILFGGLFGWAAAVTEFQRLARSWGLSYDQAGLVGAIIGLGIGFVAAVLINGPLALLVHMLQELKGIREQLASGKETGLARKPQVEPRI